MTKTLGVSGGKGGTGKSTVAVLLANKFAKEGKKVILADVDVECPNDYLLVGEKLARPKEKVFAEFPKFNNAKCKKCGLCAETCRSNAIFQPPGKYPVFIKDLCSGCGACWIVCPNKAIGTKKEGIGKIYLNKIPDSRFQIQDSGLWLITGEAKPGLEETGPVVRDVKKFALNYAQKVKADIVIFDTAPGTHCPVINALLDVDLAYAVTEPTPMGAYDLRLILDLCQKLKVPTKIILNQADLGRKIRVEKVAKSFKIKIEKEIPYSKALVQAYSKGKLLEFSLDNI